MDAYHIVLLVTEACLLTLYLRELAIIRRSTETVNLLYAQKEAYRAAALAAQKQVSELQSRLNILDPERFDG